MEKQKKIVEKSNNQFNLRVHRLKKWKLIRTSDHIFALLLENHNRTMENNENSKQSNNQFKCLKWSNLIPALITQVPT